MASERDQAVDESEKTMIGDLMHCVVEQLKVMPKPWQQMAEKEQQEFLDRIEAQVVAAAEKAINIIACRDMHMIDAVVDKVVFKDGVQVVLKVSKVADGVHEIADSQGDIVKLVIPDTDDLLQSREGKPTAEPDQRGLDLGHEYADDQKHPGDPFMSSKNEEAENKLSEAFSEEEE